MFKALKYFSFVRDIKLIINSKSTSKPAQINFVWNERDLKLILII